jgi:hypothetical protein
MAFNSKLKNGQNPRALSAVTAVAAGTVVAGNTIILDKVEPGSTVVARVEMLVNTTSLTMAPSWQVSTDNSTWLNLKPMNNAANVATAAGTGSDVTTTVGLVLGGPFPFRYARAVITTAGATAHATADKLAVSYNYVAKD